MNSVPENKIIPVGTRLGAMLLDHIIMCMIMGVFFIPVMVAQFTNAFKVTHEQAAIDPMSGNVGYLFMFGFALYLCKDVVNGRSFAKRILKFQVVDNTTGQVATPLQCFIRDIFCVLWPIEVLISLKNTSRRLGDRVAGTKLVPFDPSLEQPSISFIKLLLPLAVSCSLAFLLWQAFPQPDIPKTNFIESSYDQKESKDLEKLLSDSLGHYFTPDISIYDSIKDENLKYVSIILSLKENYFRDENGYQQLYNSTTDLIYTAFPKETFKGELKFYYKASGNFVSRSTSIGTFIRVMHSNK